MSVKRLALIAAVGAHHRTVHNIPLSPPITTTTLSAVTQLLAVTPETATTFTRATTDDDNLNLNAVALGIGATAATDNDGYRSRSNQENTSDDFLGRDGSGDGATVTAPRPSSEIVRGGISTGRGSTSEFNYFTEHVVGGSGPGTGGGLYQGHQAMRPGATLHGNVNVLLGGAMLSVVITVVCVVCYCCHRNTKKRSESMYRQQRWSDNAGPNMEVYSVEQCYESSNLYTDSPQSTSLHIPPTGYSGPPPSYDSVLAMDEFSPRPPPPPKYYQTSRHVKPRCCSTARHGAFNHNTIVDHHHHHCRKYHHPQPPTNHGTVRVRGSCSCLQRQVQELNNNRSHLNHGTTRYHTNNNNKTVPNSSDTLNNNLSNNNNVTFEIDKPLYEDTDSQLFGKLRHCSRNESVEQQPTALQLSLQQQQLHAADVENGNVNERLFDSCNNTEVSFNSNQTENTPQLFDSTDARDEVTNVNIESTSRRRTEQQQMEARELELSSNLDQKNSRCQQPHGNYHAQFQTLHHHNHQPQQELQQQAATHNLSALDTFNENGIIRMDMSQIIDTTGLPTYEAAIKLESSGYV